MSFLSITVMMSQTQSMPNNMPKNLKIAPSHLPREMHVNMPSNQHVTGIIASITDIIHGKPKYALTFFFFAIVLISLKVFFTLYHASLR
jgi:hypothetical protein